MCVGLRRISISSLYIWQNLPVKPSDPGLVCREVLFCFITDCMSIQLFSFIFVFLQCQSLFLFLFLLCLFRFSLFLINLARGLSILSTLSKKQLFVLLIFFLFLNLFYFLSDLYYLFLLADFTFCFPSLFGFFQVVYQIVYLRCFLFLKEVLNHCELPAMKIGRAHV